MPTSQPSLIAIVAPKWRTVLARLRKKDSGAGTRALLLALVGLGFWLAVFGIMYRVLRYFQGVEEIGNLVAGKLLGIILLAFLSLLLLSNLITALSTFFLAKDLDMLVVAPVDPLRFYLAKLGETVLHSSWMVILMGLPIFTAYGIVYHGGPLFPLIVAVALIPVLIIPGVLGTAATVVLVNVFPARRTRDLLSLIAIVAPKWRTVLARLREKESGAGTRALLLALVGLGCWLAVFGIMYRVLCYF